MQTPMGSPMGGGYWDPYWSWYQRPNYGSYFPMMPYGQHHAANWMWQQFNTALPNMIANLQNSWRYYDRWNASRKDKIWMDNFLARQHLDNMKFKNRMLDIMEGMYKPGGTLSGIYGDIAGGMGQIFKGVPWFQNVDQSQSQSNIDGTAVVDTGMSAFGGIKEPHLRKKFKTAKMQGKGGDVLRALKQGLQSKISPQANKVARQLTGENLQARAGANINALNTLQKSYQNEAKNILKKADINRKIAKGKNALGPGLANILLGQMGGLLEGMPTLPTWGSTTGNI